MMGRPGWIRDGVARDLPLRASGGDEGWDEDDWDDDEDWEDEDDGDLEEEEEEDDDEEWDDGS